MEPDRRLARARATLHRQEAVERSADDLVLLGLNGGNDVEHLAGTGPLELGQEGVPAPEPGCAGIAPRIAEQVVSNGDDRTSVDHDLAPAGQSESVLAAGPVEGNGDGSPPVDDDRVRAGVFDVTPADAPGRAVLLVDAPEEQGPRAVGQQGHPSGQSSHIVEVRIPGGNEVSQQLLGAAAHGPQ